MPILESVSAQLAAARRRARDAWRIESFHKQSSTPRREPFRPLPALIATLSAAGVLHCVHNPGIVPQPVAVLLTFVSAAAVATFVLAPLLRHFCRRRRTDIPL